MVAIHVATPGAQRLTMTRRTFEAARALVFLAAGADKATALAAAPAGPSPETHASLIAPTLAQRGTLAWLADRAALAAVEAESDRAPRAGNAAATISSGAVSWMKS